MKTKYNINDEVFFYIKPINLRGYPEDYQGEDACTQAVFKANIYEVRIETRRHSDKPEETSVWYDAAGMGNFIGNVRLFEREAFATAQEAQDFARKDMENTLKAIKDKAIIYQNMINALGTHSDDY